MDKVVYVSRKGNTEKVATAIAEALNVRAERVTEDMTVELVDTLFVGGAIYADKISKHLAAFLNRLAPGCCEKVVVFSTAVGDVSIHNQVKSILEPKGIKVSDSYFHCKGRFLFFCRKHPDAEDLKKAAEFAIISGRQASPR